MNVENMFLTPLGWSELNLDTNKVEQYCHSKLGSTNQSSKLDWELPNELVYTFTQQANIFHKECGLKHSVEILDSWCNYSNPEKIVKPHSHPQAFYVGVYYLYDSDAKINFINPLSQLENLIPPDLVEHYNPFNRQEMSYYPRKGMFLIHPAWILHYVDNIPGERLSIAMNFKIVSHDTVDNP